MTKDMDIDLEIEADEVAYIYLGTDKHNNLKNLDLPDSHPIKAITGLQEVVDKVGRTEDGAEVNEIVGVRVNGVPLDIAGDRTVDVVVPTSYGYTLDLDGETGIISLKDMDGVVLSTIDTNLERIVESGRYDADTNELVLDLDDGSEIRIDASRLVDVYTADGETIVESGHVFALSPGSKEALKDSADHIADTSNPHGVTKAQVGLGNVDNTSDQNKPISILMQVALDLKANDDAVVHKSGDTMTGVLIREMPDNSPVISIRNTAPQNDGYKFNDISYYRDGLLTGYIRFNSGIENETSLKAIQIVPRNASGGYAGEPFSVGWGESKGMFVTAPTPANNSDNSINVATTSWVNSASTLVHTTGNEAIAGDKTFSNGLYINIPIEAGASGAGVYRNIQFVDNGKTKRSQIRTMVGNVQTQLTLTIFKFDGSVGAELNIFAPESGGSYATAPATADTHPDTAIVTKKYLLDKISALEARIEALEGAR